MFFSLLFSTCCAEESNLYSVTFNRKAAGLVCSKERISMFGFGRVFESTKEDKSRARTVIEERGGTGQAFLEFWIS